MSAFGDFKHYFGELNENEKRAYNAILRDIESFPEEIEIPELNNEELEKVWLAVMYDNPELIMLGRECMLVSRDRKFWFSCEYAMTKDEYEQKKAELQTKADELGAKIVKETSDFDKELLIHDAIIDSCRYTDSDKLIASSAYGVLVNGSASCEGYAKAAKLLLDKAGIENYVITGTAKREDGASEGHMWNVVFIDGKPYNLDLTWDDPIGEGVTQNKRYAYFNITDEEILKTHTFPMRPPAAPRRTATISSNSAGSLTATMPRRKPLFQICSAGINRATSSTSGSLPKTLINAPLMDC